ncbi:MAG: UDP-galactopyranose mutase [Spirochaetota bacterium]
MKYDAVIAGAGLAGSVAARSLADSGRRVLVIEKHRHVAGHCHDYRNDVGITVHTYGPHIFHTTDKAIWDFVNRFTAFHFLQHRVLSYAGGKLVPFPINRDTINEVFGVSIGTGEVEAFLKAEVGRSKFNSPSKNFRDAVVSQVGERLYELFFKNYTLKQWERDPETLSPEIAKRIPVRSNRDDRYFSDRYQGVPRRGYTMMVENMLDHPNITVMLGADFFELRSAFAADLTVFTGELDRYFDRKHGELAYRSLDLVVETLDQERFQSVPVVNYPNDYDWTRITEFKLLSGETSPKTTICYEYPKEKGEPYYVVMDDENMGKREKYLKEAAALEALPMGEGKVLFIGRLAEYAYYNMDQVIGATLKKIGPFVK